MKQFKRAVVVLVITLAGSVGIVGPLAGHASAQPDWLAPNRALTGPGGSLDGFFQWWACQGAC